MIRMNVDPQSLRSLSNAFDKVIAETDDWSDPLNESGDLCVYFYKDNIDKQGFNLNANWRPLAQSTINQRRKLGFGVRPILIRTGELMNSFKRSNATKTEVDVDNTKEYAKWHQSGTKNMPSRLIMGFPEKLKKSIVIVFSNFLHSKLKRAWGRWTI